MSTGLLELVSRCHAKRPTEEVHLSSQSKATVNRRKPSARLYVWVSGWHAVAGSPVPAYRWSMRRFGYAVLVTAMLLVFPSWAAAGWSVPQTVRAPSASTTIVGAATVNARGEAAVAVQSAANHVRSAINVTVRTAGGRLSTHRVWSSARESVAGRVSVAMDDFGAVTVAWVTDGPSLRPLPQTVHAAWRSPAGRWNRARIVGHAGIQEPLPVGRGPHLAVAPAGDVLLVWDDDFARRATLQVAWRAPGHRFGAARVIGRAPNTPLGAVPSFDASGRAYLASACSGLVFSAAPHHHDFGAPIVVAKGSADHAALHFSLSLSGARQGLASWSNGSCTSDEAAGDTTGPIFASVLRQGRFGAPVLLSGPQDQAQGSVAVASANGGGVVSWTTAGPVAVFTRAIDPVGVPGATEPASGAIVPVLADGGGDRLLSAATYFLTGVPSVQGGVIARPITGPDQPAPSDEGTLAVAAPTGRASVLVWTTRLGARFSVWRP